MAKYWKRKSREKNRKAELDALKRDSTPTEPKASFQLERAKKPTGNPARTGKFYAKKKIVPQEGDPFSGK